MKIIYLKDHTDVDGVDRKKNDTVLVLSAYAKELIKDKIASKWTKETAAKNAKRSGQKSS